MSAMRERERASIARFLRGASSHFEGRDVLDVGCGLQPYRDIVEAAGGRYHGFDRTGWDGSVVDTDCGDLDWFSRDWPVVLSTQTIQYAHDPRDWAWLHRSLLEPGGILVATGPTNWPIVERTDRWRFTPRGIRTLLEDVLLEDVQVVDRAYEGEWLLGWGATARKEAT